MDLSEKRYTWGIGGYTAKAPRYRKTLSESICGMLNTGLKSTIYLGVTDEGIAEGFMMSLYQRDHFQLSLRDLLSKYKPACPEHVINISFIPILDEDEEDGVILPDPIGLDTPRWLNHRYGNLDHQCFSKVVLFPKYSRDKKKHTLLSY